MRFVDAGRNVKQNASPRIYQNSRAPWRPDTNRISFRPERFVAPARLAAAEHEHAVELESQFHLVGAVARTQPGLVQRTLRIRAPAEAGALNSESLVSRAFRAAHGRGKMTLHRTSLVFPR